MDSDGQLSEDEEAKMYAMLYYVDSTTVKGVQEPKTSATAQETRTKSNNQENETNTSNTQRHKTPQSLNDKTIVDIQNEQQKQNETPNRESNAETDNRTSMPSESFNQNTANMEQEKSSTNDRPRRRVSHSRRYWASEDSAGDVNTMYIRVRTNNSFKKSSSKLDKTIITLLNTRATGKRKSSEGSSFPDDNNVNISSNTSIDNNKSKATPAKQSKPTFATPTNILLINTSSNKGTRSNSARKNNSPKTPTISKKFNKQQTKNTPLTQKLLDKFNSARNSLKKTRALNNSESIVIESSDDDDSIIEVELPDPRHATIELDSSDESQAESKDQDAVADQNAEPNASTSVRQSDPRQLTRTASPVPSIVSSTSDDFIQADCSTLNITSGANSGPVFNFQLHGSDFCDAQLNANSCDTSTPIATKSKSASSDEIRKQNIIVSSTTRLLDIDMESNLYQVTDNSVDLSQNFATPTSKSKKKSDTRNKSYSVPEESYVLPSADVFESESSDIPESVVEVPITPLPKKKRRKSASKEESVDSTTDDAYIVDLHYTPPENDSLVMANVVGMEEPNAENDEIDLTKSSETTENTSPTKKQKKKSRRKSADLENDMHKFYNTIYDQNFDHNKIRSQMPKDKSLWKIDPADRGRPKKTPITCGHCNKTGHRSETCYKKPQVCSMCGGMGHRTTRCPNKICLNCGTPNNTFSVDCNHCKSWKNIYCGTCRENGHPSTRCPDIWRRYHLTIKNEVPLIECKKRKPKSLLFCSGCARKGHIINDCNDYIKFSNFKPASPYIFRYSPVYKFDAVRDPSAVETIQIEDDKSRGQVREDDARPKARNLIEQTDTKTKYQVRESESKTKNQVKATEKAKIQTRESDSKAKSQIKETGKTKTPTKELDKSKGQIKESDNKTKNQSTTVPPPPSLATNEDNVVSSSDSPPKHLVITITSKSSEDNAENIVRDVRVVENVRTNSPRNTRKNDTKSIVTNPNINEQTQVLIGRVDSTNNAVKDTDNKISEPTNTPKGNKSYNSVISKMKELDNAETSLILLKSQQGQILMSQSGAQFLSKLAQTYNVMVDLSSDKDGATLTLSGNANKHQDFQKDLQLHFNVGDKVLDFVPRHFIPKERSKALSKLSLEMKLLNTDLGNPRTIYKHTEDKKNAIKRKNLVNKTEKTWFKKLCKEINKGYRLLNMILIGQARLNEGGDAYTKIDDMLKFLETQKFITMSDQIRDELGASYSTIFSSYPRVDYPELLDKYYKMDRGKLKSLNTIQNLLLKDKRSMTQEELITLVRKTRDEFLNFKDVPVVCEQKRYSHTMKSLMDLEPNILKKKLSKPELLNIRNTVFQFNNYLKVCKKQVKQCNKII